MTDGELHAGRKVYTYFVEGCRDVHVKEYVVGAPWPGHAKLVTTSNRILYKESIYPSPLDALAHAEGEIQTLLIKVRVAVDMLESKAPGSSDLLTGTMDAPMPDGGVKVSPGFKSKAKRTSTSQQIKGKDPANV